MPSIPDILKTNYGSSKELQSYLERKGINHRYYKTYTKMQYAQDLLVGTKKLYFSDGQGWNDKKDSEQMQGQCAFGKCFQYMQSENVANWMLYDGFFGKKGAMIDFPGSVIKNLINNTGTVELGRFENGAFKVLVEVPKDKFSIEILDVLYVDPSGSTSDYRVTRADEHCTISASVVNAFPIIHKSFAWSYERECRMLILVDKVYENFIQDQKITTAAIELSDKDIEFLKERFYKSPVYNDTKFKINPSLTPQASKLTGEVEWKLDSSIEDLLKKYGI